MARVVTRDGLLCLVAFICDCEIVAIAALSLTLVVQGLLVLWGRRGEQKLQEYDGMMEATPGGCCAVCISNCVTHGCRVDAFCCKSQSNCKAANTYQQQQQQLCFFRDCRCPRNSKRSTTSRTLPH